MQPSNATHSASPRVPTSTGARRPHILIVDDDVELRRLLAAALRRDGYEPVEAADGSEALQYVDACLRHEVLEPPDLVIADIRMPRFSGLQLLASIRARPHVENPMPVILITAFGDPETHAHAKRLGALAVVDKPFDVNVLRALTKQVVSPRHLEPEPGADFTANEIAGIVHDLKNPLHVIGLELELVRHHPDDARSVAALERVTRNVNFLGRLVHQLLEIGEAQDGVLELRLDRVDLAALLARALDRCMAGDERRRVSLEGIGAVMVDADETRLERVISNLVRNAIAYSPPQSPIKVRLDGDGETALVSVIDSGEGLSSLQACGLFHKYRRQTSQDSEGSGLGLYVSRRIVEAHGGRLDVDTRPGAGSRFYFELPIVARPPRHLGPTDQFVTSPYHNETVTPETFDTTANSLPPS